MRRSFDYESLRPNTYLTRKGNGGQRFRSPSEDEVREELRRSLLISCLVTLKLRQIERGKSGSLRHKIREKRRPEWHQLVRFGDTKLSDYRWRICFSYSTDSSFEVLNPSRKRSQYFRVACTMNIERVVFQYWILFKSSLGKFFFQKYWAYPSYWTVNPFVELIRTTLFFDILLKYWIKSIINFTWNHKNTLTMIR